jgi:hypothetical protein
MPLKYGDNYSRPSINDVIGSISTLGIHNRCIDGSIGKEANVIGSFFLERSDCAGMP